MIDHYINMIKIIIQYFYEYIGPALSISYAIKLSNNCEFFKKFYNKLII